MNVSILHLQSEGCGQISANAKRRNAASAYYRTDDRLTTPAAISLSRICGHDVTGRATGSPNPTLPPRNRRLTVRRTARVRVVDPHCP
jgi:hypothetical protein